MSSKDNEIKKEIYYTMKKYRVPGLTVGLFKEGLLDEANKILKLAA
jgi:hypothetical protein